MSANPKVATINDIGRAHVAFSVISDSLTEEVNRSELDPGASAADGGRIPVILVLK